MDGVTTTPLQDILPPPSSTGFQSALLLISSKSDDPTMRNPAIIIPPSILPAWISQISCEDLGYNYRTLFHPTMKEPQQPTLTLNHLCSLNKNQPKQSWHKHSIFGASHLDAHPITKALHRSLAAGSPPPAKPFDTPVTGMTQATSAKWYMVHKNNRTIGSGYIQLRVVKAWSKEAIAVLLKL